MVVLPELLDDSLAVVARSNPGRCIVGGGRKSWNAFGLEVVVEPYVDLRKLGNKLEGVATYESHKQRGRVKFVDITPHLQKAARVLRLLTRVEPSKHHNIISANHLLRLHRPQQHVTNWVD